MDLAGAGGYKDSDKKRTDKRGIKKKILYSSFPWVEKLNKEGNKEAGFNRKSPKISLNASKRCMRVTSNMNAPLYF